MFSVAADVARNFKGDRTVCPVSNAECSCPIWSFGDEFAQELAFRFDWYVF